MNLNKRKIRNKNNHNRLKNLIIIKIKLINRRRKWTESKKELKGSEKKEKRQNKFKKKFKNNRILNKLKKERTIERPKN